MCRWAVEQLSGVMSMSREAASARTGTLHFLALHAFFTADAASVKKVYLSSNWLEHSLLNPALYVLFGFLPSTT